MDKEVVRNEVKIAITNGSAIIGAYLFKRLTEKVLETVFDKELPESPESNRDMDWIEAIGWAAFTGALAGTLKLVIKKGTMEQLDKVI